jgi:hypothetical protein
MELAMYTMPAFFHVAPMRYPSETSYWTSSASIPHSGSRGGGTEARDEGKAGWRAASSSAALPDGEP